MAAADAAASGPRRSQGSGIMTPSRLQVDVFQRRCHLFDDDSELWSNDFVKENVVAVKNLVPRLREHFSKRNCGLIIGKMENMWGSQHAAFFSLVQGEPHLLFQRNSDSNIYRVAIEKDANYGGRFVVADAAFQSPFVDPGCPQIGFSFANLPPYIQEARGDILDLVMQTYQGTTVCTQMHSDNQPVVVDTKGWAFLMMFCDGRPYESRCLRVFLNLETGDLAMKRLTFSTPTWSGTELDAFDDNLVTNYLAQGPAAALQPQQPILTAAVQAVDAETAKALFNQTSNSQYTVSRVQLLSGERNFAVMLRLASDSFTQLNNRREGPNKAIFEMPMPANLLPEDRQDKTSLVKWFQDSVKTRDWTGLTDFTYANVLPVWHGASSEAIDSISVDGFASLVNDDGPDPGWFANGRYATAEAEYACRYASTYPTSKSPNENGEWVVLLCAAVVGLAYPITPGQHDFPTGPLPPTNPAQCKHYGKSHHKPADAHIVSVDGNYMCTKPDQARFHEIVFDRDTTILPLAKIFFRCQ